MQWRTFVFGIQPGGDSPADYWYLGHDATVEPGNTLVRTLVEIEFGYRVIQYLDLNLNLNPMTGITCGIDLNPHGPVDTGGNVHETDSRDWLWTGCVGPTYMLDRAPNSTDPSLDVWKVIYVYGHTGAAESVKGQRKIFASDWGIGFNWQFTGATDPTTMLPVPASEFDIKGTAYVRTLWRF